MTPGCQRPTVTVPGRKCPAAVGAEVRIRDATEVPLKHLDDLARFRHPGRDDVPIEAVATFLSFAANGLALRVSLGEPIPDLDAIAKLIEQGVAPLLSLAGTQVLPSLSRCQIGAEGGEMGFRRTDQLPQVATKHTVVGAHGSVNTCCR